MAGIPEDSRLASVLGRHPQWRTWTLACALAAVLFAGCVLAALALAPAPEQPVDEGASGAAVGTLERESVSSGAASASEEGTPLGAVGGAVASVQEDGEQPAAVPVEGQEPAADAQEETPTQADAFMAAKLHMSEMPYSHAGMVAALEGEGYAHEDAVYAADKLGVDWNAKAGEMAVQYLETMDFTREDLVDQLIYEGFTREQAEGGVTAAGL